MTAKKKILIALSTVVAIVTIVVTSVLGTVAYLTSSAAVSNVFTIGNVQMTMYESKVDSNGVIIDPSAPKTADTNSYHLVCDKEYVKDPTIYITAGSESSYLFIIARNDISEIEAADPLTMKEQLFVNGWMKYGVAATGNIYVYTGIEKDAGWIAAVEEICANNDPSLKATHEEKKAVAAARAAALEALYTTYNGGVKATGVAADGLATSVDLFKKFTIDPHADISTYGAAKVNITAVAIQTSGFGGTGNEALGTKPALDEAWAAVIATYPYIHTSPNP